MKAVNPAWSLNAFAKSLEVKNGTTIYKMLNGERNLGEHLADKICNYFDFDDEKRNYFKGLMKLEQFKDDKSLYSIILKGIKYTQINKEVEKILKSSDTLDTRMTDELEKDLEKSLQIDYVHNAAKIFQKGDLEVGKIELNNYTATLAHSDMLSLKEEISKILVQRCLDLNVETNDDKTVDTYQIQLLFHSLEENN